MTKEQINKSKYGNKRTKSQIEKEVAQAHARGEFHIAAYQNWITGFDFYNNRGEVRKTKNIK